MGSSADVHFSTRVRSADPASRATMQYFTPQEMAGGMRYGGKCKVGNWNESATLDEVRFRAKSLHTFVRRASRPLGAHPTSSYPPLPSPAADSRPGVPRQEAGRHAEDGPTQPTHGQGARTGTSAVSAEAEFGNPRVSASRAKRALIFLLFLASPTLPAAAPRTQSHAPP